MKMIRNMGICLVASLLSVPLLYGQALSKYRNFSLGMRLTELSKQVNATPDEVIVVHHSPALIQELTSWPLPPYQSTSPAESVQEILFSFYNGALYKMVVTYESSATEGLTAEDMTRALSAKYGVATLPIAEANPTAISYGSPAEPVAFWQDSQYLVTLSRSPLSKTFQLVMLSKQMNGQAETAIAEAVTQESEDAPQKEVARLKKEADDLETQRQNNLKTFRP
ncbi:MAG: hypothetical protein WAN23_01925 [Candidatus Acidiferrales bacterium]